MKGIGKEEKKNVEEESGDVEADRRASVYIQEGVGLFLEYQYDKYHYLRL